jgi:predicted HTH transcriptional regulator
MSDLRDKIEGLISLKKEGEFWDFKLKHHDNPVDLVKDITCLANTVRHKGSRYLILGVCPDTYQVTGIAAGATRRSQADIISTLRNANFAAAHFPDIRLETIEMDGKQIDVIVIADTAYKPYYLETDYTKTGKTMRAGVVFSRTQDANTPNDRTAPTTDIEQMWRERFGLSQTPLERVTKYLQDKECWKQVNGMSHHKNFPEFTIKENGNDHSIDYTQEWTRGEIGSSYSTGNAATLFEIKYHQTTLAEIHTVMFDGGKKSIVAPDWEAIGTGRIYFYLEDSVEYAYQRYISNIYGRDFSKCLRKTNCSGEFDLPIFKNRSELDAFIRFCNIEPADRPETNVELQNELFYELLGKYNAFIGDDRYIRGVA